jgi:G:T-mismatch repair DNA endonuclease (very short patch repair protein)
MRPAPSECVDSGYRVLPIWECETCSPTTLAKRLHEELELRRRDQAAFSRILSM